MDIASLAEGPLFARLEPALWRCLLDDQSAQTAVEKRGDKIFRRFRSSEREAIWRR